MEEIRIILSNKLHQLNLKYEHLLGELDKIKESSEAIIAVLMELKKHEEPGSLKDTNII